MFAARAKLEMHTNQLTHLDNVVIKQQPEVMTFHYGNVVTPIWTTEKKKTTTMYQCHKVLITLYNLFFTYPTLMCYNLHQN